MKLIRRAFTKDGEGSVKLIPEEGEDLWHVYNLVREGDLVKATTFRKIQKDTGAGAESEKVKVTLEIQVESVDFDPEGAEIRLKGKNLTETEHIKLGAYHTLTLEINRAFELHKQTWDVLDVERVKEACDAAASADLAAVLITEGLATVCLVGSSCTLLRGAIEGSIPKKRGAAAAGYDKAVEKFFGKVYQAVVRHVDWAIVRCLVVAGPGFTKEQFKTFMEAEAVRQNYRPLILNKAKVVLAHASSAYQHALKEVLASPAILSQIKDTKAAREVQVLREFMVMMGADPGRAFYGPAEVLAASDMGAIQKLLISDSLFRVNNVAERRRYAALVEDVQGGGGEVVLFSAMHVSGQRLDQLTGVAAILRFPVPELEQLNLGPEPPPEPL